MPTQRPVSARCFGRLARLFEQIVQAARQAGLVQEVIGDRMVWTVSPDRAGTPIEVTLA